MKLLVPGRLRTERDHRGITQADLGAAVDGYSVRQIRNYESSDRCPLSVLTKIIDYFNEWNKRSAKEFPLLTVDDFLEPEQPQETLVVKSKSRSETEHLNSKTPDLSNIPFRRNDFFTGRETLLSEVAGSIESRESPLIALSGLGGIGKTQLIVEFIHRYCSFFQQVMWVSADDFDSLRIGMFRAVRDLENLRYDRSDENNAIPALKSWMGSNDSWLLVIDNADDPKLLDQFLPSAIGGSVILTSRAQFFDNLGIVAKKNIPEFSQQEGVEFLTKRLSQSGYHEQESILARLHDQLNGLPLALEQAAAYVIEKQVSSVADFIKEFKKQRLGLLKNQKPRAGNYNETVTTTWLMNFSEVRKESQAAIDLMKTAAALESSSPVPFSYMIDATPALPTALRQKLEEAEVKSIAVSEALAPLARFSLVQVSPQEQTFTIHPLVQEVVRNLDESW